MSLGTDSCAASEVVDGLLLPGSLLNGASCMVFEEVCRAVAVDEDAISPTLALPCLPHTL